MRSNWVLDLLTIEISSVITIGYETLCLDELFGCGYAATGQSVSKKKCQSCLKKLRVNPCQFVAKTKSAKLVQSVALR